MGQRLVLDSALGFQGQNLFQKCEDGKVCVDLGGGELGGAESGAFWSLIVC